MRSVAAQQYDMVSGITTDFDSVKVGSNPAVVAIGNVAFIVDTEYCRQRGRLSISG